MTESPEPERPEATPPPTTRPGPTPPPPRVTAGDMHTGPDNNASRETPSPGTLAAQDRKTMPPPPPSPRQSGDPHGLDELRRAYDVYQGTSAYDLVSTLRGHVQGVPPDRRFAAALLPHGATMELRQHPALLTRGQHTRDDLIEGWTWWFNDHRPHQGRIWVPHLAWAHMLIARSTRTRPAPGPGGRERAAPQLNADALNISPDIGLAGEAGQPDRGGTASVQLWSATRTQWGRRHTRSLRGAAPPATSPWWWWRTATTTN